MKKEISLWGEWQFELDNDKVGLEEHYETKPFHDSISLPTTTSEAQKGELNKEALTGSLSLKYKTTGYAWYRKELSLKEEDINKPIYLFLERTRISYLWIDGSYVGTFDSLSTPHLYHLTPFITNSRPVLTIMTSNTDYPINGGHLTSPDTQTNWNGILGKINLTIYDKLYIKSVKTQTEYDKKALTLEIAGINTYTTRVKAILSITSLKAENDLDVQTEGEETFYQPVLLSPGENIIKAEYPFKTQVKYWDEFDPNLYKIHLNLMDQTNTVSYDKWDILFGMHNFKAENNHFTINGSQTFLRGKHDGLVFPLTGYAPMEVEEWTRILSIAKAYGINHYRFHTCCPPEAAFIAADKLGIYFSPELPFWGSFYSKEDENYNEKIQNYLEEEGYRILSTYGNHPSFVMFSLGNELWGDKTSVNDLLGKFKVFDGRRLYTQGSNNFQFVPCILPNDDYFVGVRFSKHRLFRGSYAMCDAPLGHIQTEQPDNIYNYDNIIRYDKNMNKADWISKEKETIAKKKDEIEIQYETTVKKVTLEEAEEELIPAVPVISHEIGQYTFYPDFKEIEKYTGVTQARNLLMFKDRLAAKNLLDFSEKFFKAAGLFAVECYKRELEAAIRSSELSGFHLLDLQDFPGQGTALVGILNAFMENKGLITAKEWLSFCSSLTIQALLPKYVYSSKETVDITFLLCNYSKEVFNEPVNLRYTLRTEDTCFIEGTVKSTNPITLGVNTIGVATFTLPESVLPLRLTLDIRLADGEIFNSYDLYSYPPVNEAPATGYTNSLEEAIRFAKKGEAVLFLPPLKSNPNSIPGTYCTDFWCYPMFRSISESMNKPLPVGTLGLLIDKEHLALSQFPSEIYSTPSWWHIVMNSCSTILDDTAIKPIVQTIDNFERNHRLGLIYEAAITDSTNRTGKILVCTSPLNHLDTVSPEINWLLKSLVSYSLSPQFNPDYAMTSKEFKELFTAKEI